MTLQELIEEASIKDPVFKSKLEWYTIQRKKQPDLDWLMGWLEIVLGYEYVQAAAEEQIRQQNGQKVNKS